MSYVALRNEPRMGIGDWTHSLIQGEVFDCPDDVAASLKDAGLIRDATPEEETASPEPEVAEPAEELAPEAEPAPEEAPA